LDKIYFFLKVLLCICSSEKNPVELYKSSMLDYYEGGVRVVCDQCDCKINPNQDIYHCKKNKNQIHPNGYDLCVECAQILINEQKDPKSIICQKFNMNQLKNYLNLNNKQNKVIIAVPLKIIENENKNQFEFKFNESKIIHFKEHNALKLLGNNNEEIAKKMIVIVSKESNNEIRYGTLVEIQSIKYPKYPNKSDIFVTVVGKYMVEAIKIHGYTIKCKVFFENKICVCGRELVKTQVNLCYPSKKEKSNVLVECDICHKTVMDAFVYHCIKKKTQKVHKLGYDVCLNCASWSIESKKQKKKKQIEEENYENQQLKIEIERIENDNKQLCVDNELKSIKITKLEEMLNYYLMKNEAELVDDQPSMDNYQHLDTIFQCTTPDHRSASFQSIELKQQKTQQIPNFNNDNMLCQDQNESNDNHLHIYDEFCGCYHGFHPYITSLADNSPLDNVQNFGGGKKNNPNLNNSQSNDNNANNSNNNSNNSNKISGSGNSQNNNKSNENNNGKKPNNNNNFNQNNNDNKKNEKKQFPIKPCDSHRWIKNNVWIHFEFEKALSDCIEYEDYFKQIIIKKNNTRYPNLHHYISTNKEIVFIESHNIIIWCIYVSLKAIEKKSAIFIVAQKNNNKAIQSLNAFSNSK